MKYIDSEKLLAEINERLMSVELAKLGNHGSHRVWAYNDVKEIICYLQQEQPEVDLEKSRNLIRDTLNGVTRLGSLCDDQTIEHAVDNLINELGIAGKEESVSVAESPSKTFPRVNEFDCGSGYRH